MRAESARVILSRASVCLRSLILLTSLTHVACSGDDDGGGSPDTRSNFDLATSTNAITFTRTCPSASTETQLYTATTTTIEYCECDPSGPKGEGLVFTKE
jgi:hypothetical protein